MRIEGYHLPRRLILPIGLDILRGNQRSFAADCDVMVQAMPKPPLVRGLEQIPVSGPLALVANHYEGPGLWIGWSAAVLTSAIAQVRPDPVPVHWLVLRDMDRGRIRGVKKLAPATSWAFERVARAWSMASLPGPGIPATRAVAVRTLLRLSLPPPTGRGRPVGLFPEGEFGSLDRLGEPAAGSGALLALLARHGVPVLPAGVWHEQGSLHAGFGPCILPADRGSAAEQVMQVIAELLPPKMRGRFQTASAPALSARRGVKALTEPAKPAALEQT